MDLIFSYCTIKKSYIESIFKKTSNGDYCFHVLLNFSHTLFNE